MDANQLLKINSCRIKDIFKPFDPEIGDRHDPERFLFNVRGIRKVFLPLPMKKVPWLNLLMKAGSLSKFIRTPYFKKKFKKVSCLLSLLNYTRLKYDFAYWLYKKSQDGFSFEGNKKILRELQKTRLNGKPVRLIILGNSTEESAKVINLFFLWIKEYSKPSMNVMTVSPSNQMSKRIREDLLQFGEQNPEPVFNFCKTSVSSTLYSPATDSKFWFGSAVNPDCSRARNFFMLLLAGMDSWRDNEESPAQKVLTAAFPVVTNDKDSAIIMHGCCLKRDSLFQKEWKAALRKESEFQPVVLPWHLSVSNLYRFDFFDEKMKFASDIWKYRNKRKFPHFPKVSGKLLYKLWENGASLEAIHWLAAEASFYKKAGLFIKSKLRELEGFI